MSLITEINQKLVEAARAYYAGDSKPIMSDAEYDSLEAQLAGLVKANPEEAAAATVLTKVGADGSGRVKHDRPMRSITNTYSYEEAFQWVRSLASSGFPRITIGPKYDGISASLHYRGGTLVKALTRGDGDAGEDIFPQVLAVSSIPKRIQYREKVEIRGELVIEKSTMARLNVQLEAKGLTPYASCRNLVAGTMKLKDRPQEVTDRNVQFMPWEVYVETIATDSMRDQLAYFARENGFRVCEDQMITSPAGFEVAFQQWVSFLGADRDIDLDGLVIKIDDMPTRNRLGVGSKFANFQICFKNQNMKAETTLLDVVWQVGRQGRLSPVGIVEPVVLGGATISRVSLNNMSWITEMGLKIGSRIEIIRSGDVIPKVVGCLD